MMNPLEAGALPGTVARSSDPVAETVTVHMDLGGDRPSIDLRLSLPSQAHECRSPYSAEHLRRLAAAVAVLDPLPASSPFRSTEHMVAEIEALAIREASLGLETSLLPNIGARATKTVQTLGKSDDFQSNSAAVSALESTLSGKSDENSPNRGDGDE